MLCIGDRMSIVLEGNESLNTFSSICILVRYQWLRGLNIVLNTILKRELLDLKLSEVSKRMNLPIQTLRLGLQQDKFPFGTAIRTSEKRYVYWVSEKRLEKYLEGVDGEKV